MNRLFVREFEDITYEVINELKWVNFTSPGNTWRFIWMTGILLAVLIGVVMYGFKQCLKVGPTLVKNSTSLVKLFWTIFQGLNLLRGLPAILFLIMSYYHEGIDTLDKLPRPLHEPEIRNDHQNVHDSGVTAHITTAIQALNKAIPNPRPWTEISWQISQFLENQSADAQAVFNHILIAEMTHVVTGKTEIQVLGLVWERIHDPINKDSLQSLEQSFIEELSDCLEDGQVLCGMGRISRMLQTLEKLDAENIVDLKPMWAIECEIGNYFNHYLSKLKGRVPKKYIEALDASERTPQQEVLIKEFNKSLHKSLDRKLTRAYVEKGIISQPRLDVIMKPYWEELGEVTTIQPDFIQIA